VAQFDWRSQQPVPPHDVNDLYRLVLRGRTVRLKVSDIDSKRMMLRVVQGKGGIDREVPLGKKLLPVLREYYAGCAPRPICFPGTVNHLRADKPITEKMVWHAVREASNRAESKNT